MKKLLLSIMLILISVPAWAKFPTTPILDTFTRADNPNLGPNWTNDLGGSYGGNMKITSNTAEYDGVANAALVYWNQSTFSGNIEAYATSPGIAGSGLQIWMTTDTSSYNGYSTATNNPAGNISINRQDANTATVLLQVVLTYSAGDSIGFTRNNATGLMGLWYRSGSGAWVLEGTVTDTTYTPKYLALRNGTTVTHTNFGGGLSVVNAFSVSGKFKARGKLKAQ